MSYEAGLEERTENIPVDRLGDPMELGSGGAPPLAPSGYVDAQAVGIDGDMGSSTL